MTSIKEHGTGHPDGDDHSPVNWLLYLLLFLFPWVARGWNHRIEEPAP